MKSVKISIPIKNSTVKKKKNNSNKLLLEGQIEVKIKCLKYFYGCWVKVVNKKSNEYNSGGFLTKMDLDSVYLRSIQKSELNEFSLTENRFYVKEDCDQYFSMQQIELEKERNTIENLNVQDKIKILKEKEKIFEHKKILFEKQVNRFEKVKNKFFKLFQDGKAKILI